MIALTWEAAMNSVQRPRPRRQWLRWLAALSLLAVLLWLGMAYAVAYELTRRAHPRQPEPLPVGWSGTWDAVTLRTADGETLGAWNHPGNVGKPAVVLVHGNGASRSALGPQMEWLAERGYGVLAVTLRAHGDSTGDENDHGYSARHDVMAAIAFVAARDPDRPVIVWGQSIGGVAAVLSARETAGSVDGYILECVYRDLDTTVRNRLRLYLPRVFAEVAYAGMWTVSPLTSPHRSQTSPVRSASDIPPTVPVLLLAGEADQRAKAAESSAIAERIGANAEVVVIPHGDHLQLLTADRGTYFGAVERLLSRVTATAQ